MSSNGDACVDCVDEAELEELQVGSQLDQPELCAATRFFSSSICFRIVPSLRNSEREMDL
jgi:hypothetical protein